MCGIVGYVGPRPAIEVLISGLERLEYRGYDSAGLAIHDGNVLAVVRRAGRIADLVDAVGVTGGAEGSTGIGHTRWATHGAPTTRNAHPHGDCAQQVAVAHNGIIENWLELKDDLILRGHVFSSDTDTEVVAHLIEEMAELPLAEAVRRVMEKAEGALALAVVRTRRAAGGRRRPPGEPAGGRGGRWRELHRLGYPRLPLFHQEHGRDR